MVDLILGYDPNEKNNWKSLGLDYSEETYNNKLVVKINERLWEKVCNIMWLKRKGYDSLIMIDGKRRTGKSTLASAIAYLLDPDMSIKNFVKGMEDSADAINNAKDDSVLIFDEGTLVGGSKDIMTKEVKTLLKIIDVVGQKRLTLIFCMPSFFDMARPLAVKHSQFLIHVYTDERLNRGRFAYFGTRSKEILYSIGKKNNQSYSKPAAEWTGKFYDFHLPFEKEYFKLKKQSLQEAITPKNKKEKPLTMEQWRAKFAVEYKENNPDTSNKEIAKGFGISERAFYRQKSIIGGMKTEDKPSI